MGPASIKSSVRYPGGGGGGGAGGALPDGAPAAMGAGLGGGGAGGALGIRVEGTIEWTG